VTKEPFHIPLRLGLLGADGKDLELDLKSSTSPQKQIGKGLIELFRKEESFVFKNVETVPVVSINRGFSAPVKIAAPHSEDELAFLMANDSDEFNRYEAGQELAGRVIKGLLADIENKRELELNPIFAEAWGKVLKSEALAPAIKSLCLELPNEAILHQGFNPVNFHGIYKARTFVLTALAKTHKATLVALYESLATAREYKIDAKAVGERELKNRILSMLALTGDFNHFELANRQFSKATNMTDELGALKVLVHNECPQRDAAIESFYNKWKHETLVMQKWLVTQAGAPLEHALDDVKKLEGNKVYDKSVPNLFRSLWGSFAMNYTQFHHPTGRGYKAVADSVMEVDKINPQMASRVVGAFKDFKRLPKELAPLMKTELERILATEKLSKNTFEIASKILNA
jgi:aminopeptidase N